MLCESVSPPTLLPSFSFLHRLKGNLISWNFIFNLVYAKCQFAIGNIQIFCDVSSIWENQTHDDDDFPEHLCRLLSSSREIIPRYSLRNESSCLKIFSSDSPTHRIDFLRYIFLNFFVSSTVWRGGSWIETLEYMRWWRNGAIFSPFRRCIARPIKKWSGKFPFTKKNHI